MLTVYYLLGDCRVVEIQAPTRVDADRQLDTTSFVMVEWKDENGRHVETEDHTVETFPADSPYLLPKYKL
jgi:hypothetical protein